MTGRSIVWSGCMLACLLGGAIIAPHGAPGQSCPGEQCSGDFNCDGQVTVDEVLVSAINALNGCPQGISAEQACGDVAMAQCAKLDQCVVNGTTSRYGGVAVCRERQMQTCLARLTAEGTGNNPPAVELCAQQLPTAACTDYDLNDIPDCLAKVGMFPNGAACAFSGQCQSSNCAIANGTNCGTCAAPNAPGDSCAATSCSQGVVCVSSTQLCQMRGALNAVCEAGLPCGPGLSCVTPAGASQGTCQTAGAVGAACDPQRKTAASCDPNLALYCSDTSHTCAPVSYTSAGGQCGFVQPIVIECTNASTCFGAQGSTPGACVANAADGQPCDTQSGPSCIPPARCVTGSASATSGTCQLPNAASCPM